MKDLKLSFLIPDTHVPFHDRKAYNLALEVASYLDPDEVCLEGDFADFYSVNSHGKSAEIGIDLIKEVEAVNECLDELDKLFARARRVYVEGNHEYRLERFLNTKCPELFGVTDWRLLFNLEKRKWASVGFTPDQAYKVLGSDLILKHQPPSSNGDPGVAIRKSLQSVTYGHIHRITESSAVGLDGKQYVAFSSGWLGNKNHPVFRYVKDHWQWQLGFALVWVDPQTKKFYHQIVRIHEDYTCMVNGKRFKG